jgi:serine/threonine protein kinase
VALKEVKTSPTSTMPLSERARYLEHEARIHGHVQSGRKQHENIVECFGVVEEEGSRYLAIGYHPAETFGALIRKNRAYPAVTGVRARPPLEAVDVRTLGGQLLKALLHLRDRQVIHRDIKPANVLYLVNEDGRASLVKLIDFGVALGLGEGHPPDLFGRQVVGTMAYMAPEMVLSQSSFASDLFSAGVIFYQLMSGKLPLPLGKPKNREEMKEALKRVVREKRIPLLRTAPSWMSEPGLRDIASLVDRMISLDPTRRPPVDHLYRDWEEAWGTVPEDALSRPVSYAP